MTTVEITETDREFRIAAYASRIDNPYLARLPKCWCERTPCTAAYDHGKGVKSAASDCDGSDKNHCHASFGRRHREHVEHLAGQVAKTYGAKYRPQRALLGITEWMRRTGKLFAACPSWPVVENRPLSPPCDCDSCMGSVARFGTAAERAALRTIHLPEQVEALVANMRDGMAVRTGAGFAHEVEVPTWLAS